MKSEGKTESLESTADLLRRVRTGDESARNRLTARLIPVLTRWAHGRLRPSARGLMDTDDLVQTTMIRALSRIDSFEPQGEGSFLAYLRTILINLIRDEVRKRNRHPSQEALDEALPDHCASPLEMVIGWEAIERYEQALDRLSSDYREAVLLRIEFGYSYEQVAVALNRPTANAARLLVSRALVKLAEEMRDVS